MWFWAGIVCMIVAAYGLIALDNPATPTASAPALVDAERLYGHAVYYSSHVVLLIGVVYVIVGLMKAKRAPLV